MPNYHPNPIVLTPSVPVTSEVASVIVDTTAYVSAHGKDPKGYGRWAFAVSRQAPSHLTVDFMARYEDARLLAKKWAARMQLITVYLQP